MDPCLGISCKQLTHFGGTTLYVICEYPPPPFRPKDYFDQARLLGGKAYMTSRGAHDFKLGIILNKKQNKTKQTNKQTVHVG